MDTFKIISGFSRYAISESGDIKRLEYTSMQYQPSAGNMVEYTMPEKMIVPCGKQRYNRVSLTSDDGKRKTLLVHRLVALTFIGVDEDNSKIFVNHIDSNTYNNHISNLEWVTQSGNVIHAINAGRKVPTQKQRECGATTIKQNSKVRIKFKDKSVVDNIKLRIADGEKMVDLSREYNVSIDTIYRVKKGTNECYAN
jgi:hypothetical protein